jgi:hypothetical protein
MIFFVYFNFFDFTSVLELYITVTCQASGYFSHGLQYNRLPINSRHLGQLQYVELQSRFCLIP